MGTFVIAEAACGWNGDLKQAEHSIRMAKAHGADAWKTQWTSDPVGMAGRRGIKYSAVADKFNRLAWPFEHHAELWALCREHGIEYMCTTFLPKDIEKVEPFVKRFKISAFEARYDEFIREHFKHVKPIILSETVMNPAAYWEDEYEYISHLHCVSEYPTPVERLCLKMNVHGKHRGLSDHTTSTLTGALAVAAGATIIEKHVKTIDMLPSDPDQPHSLSMNGTDSAFGEYVRNIRIAEAAL